MLGAFPAVPSRKEPRVRRQTVLLVAIAGAVGTLAGCGDSTSDASPEPTQENSPMAEASTGELKVVLDETRASFSARADEATKTLYQEGIDAVVAQGAVEAAKQVGDTAPAFELPNATGTSVRGGTGWMSSTGGGAGR